MKLGVIGGGAMAEAIVGGALAKKLFMPSEIIVSEPRVDRRAYWQETYQVQTTAENQAVTGATLLLLAIKPQVLAEVSAGLEKPLMATVGVSILAGISLTALTKTIPGIPWVRAMPNTPALISAGITALAGSVPDTVMAEVEALFTAVGSVIRVPENLFDAVTGLSGSGPAYIALVAEALMDGGVAAGLPRPTARALALATLKGSVELMLQENLHPAELKDRVTSPGGTTIAGLAELEKAAVRGAFIQAILAAAARSAALGKALET